MYSKKNVKCTVTKYCRDIGTFIYKKKKKKTIIWQWHPTYALKKEKKNSGISILNKKNHYMKFNPCIQKKKTLFRFPFAFSLPSFIKLILKENFCILPERSTEISVLFHHFKFLGPLQILFSVFSLFICKFQIGFLLTPIRRIFNTTQLIRLGSSHFFFHNFRSTCSSPNLRCVSFILSVSSIVKILWSLMCCYSLFCSDFRTKLF